MKIFNIHWIGLFIALAVFSSCDENRNHPGYTFFPDMEESVAYETWSENPYMPGGKTMTGPVEGTIATHEHGYNFVKTPEDELRAASLINPFVDELNNDYAKMLYDRYCLICHGPEGNGQGSLFTSGKYPIPPASFFTERATGKTDGQILHNIRAGFGVMGPHGFMISMEDTWQLVNYIRYLQKLESTE
jgi:hypothetical protein